MVEAVCYGFIYLFEVLACFLFFENIYFRKEDNKLLLFVSYFLTFAVTFGVNFFSIPLLNVFAFIVSYFLIALICYESRIRDCIISSLLLAFFMFITEIIILYSSTFILKINLDAYQNDILTLITQSSLSKLLFFCVLFVASKIIKRKVYKSESSKYATMLIALPTASIITLYILYYWGCKTSDVSNLNAALTVCAILLLFANLFVFYVYEMVQKTNQENLQLQLERQSIEIRTEYYALLADEYEKSRVLIHDIKNHLRYIETKTADGAPQEVFDYIDSIREDFGLNERIRYSGSSIIDVIINRYHRQCKEAGIGL